MSVTVVAGVPGVGVSRICTDARKSLDDDYLLLNFGDAMLEEAVASGMADSRGDLAALSLADTRRLQRRASEAIATRAADRSVLLSTHLAIRTARGFVPGMPDEVLRDLSPNAFVLVEADPEAILDRRDETRRQYGAGGSRAVAFEQDLNRAAAMTYAIDRGVPVELVQNTGDVESAVARLVDVLSVHRAE